MIIAYPVVALSPHTAVGSNHGALCPQSRPGTSPTVPPKGRWGFLRQRESQCAKRHGASAMSASGPQ